jgi:hypothetical protein
MGLDTSSGRYQQLRQQFTARTHSPVQNRHGLNALSSSGQAFASLWFHYSVGSRFSISVSSRAIIWPTMS